MRQFLSKWKTPIVLLGLLFLSYGLMIPWLGYSFDDWNFVYYATRGVEGLSEIFNYDGHPQAVWSYLLNFRLLGYNPLYWHLLSFFWRGLATLSFWVLLQELWANSRRQNFLASALFALYPFFTLQVFSITFYEIWIGFTLINLSFIFTIKAIRKPKKKTLFIILAILFRIAFIFTKEYAWFLELMRPALIWYALPQEFPLKRKISSIFKIWLPYALIFLSTVIWRGFLYTPTRKYFQVQNSIFSNPLQTFFTWILDLIPDILTLLLTSWYRILNVDDFYLTRPFNILVLISGMLIATSVFFYLKTIPNGEEKSNQHFLWHKQAFFVALPSILFGIIPFYIAGYSIHLTEFPFNARFAFGMLPGAALIVTAIIETVFSKQETKLLIIAILLGLTTTWHIRYTNDFRKIWHFQSSILEQLTWRVPGIEKNTALFIHSTTSPQTYKKSVSHIALSGDFSTSMALNAIYQMDPETQGNQLSYWLFSSLEPLTELPETTPLKTGHAIVSFEGNTKDSLVFLYSPENGECLHLIQSGDEEYKRYPAEIKDIAPYLSAERINPALGQQNNLRNQILHSQKNSWCYYYERADLARQSQNWDEIVDLWKTSRTQNVRATHGTEYIPFIDGLAHTTKWKKALELTKTANKLSPAMDSILCPLWNDIDQSMPASTEKENAIKQAQDLLQCIPW